MAYKFNTLKSIKKGLIGPNILFPAAYLLFSAEVCTGAPKHKPTNQMGRTSSSLAAKPVAHLDKIEEAVELSKDNTDALEAADSVDQTDEIEEALEGSEGNTEGLKAAESVDPLDKKKEGLGVSNDNKAKVSTVSGVVPPPVGLQAAQGQQTTGVVSPPLPGALAGAPVAPVVSARVGTAPPPPPLPMTGQQVPASPIMLTKVSLNQDTAQQSNQSGQQKPNQDGKAIGNLNNEVKIILDLKKVSSDPVHRECMDEILQSLPSEYTINIRSVFIQKYLEASDGTYSCTKEKAVEWFLRQSDKDINNKRYNQPILNLILEQVKINEAAYDSKKVSLLKSLTKKID